MNKTVVVDLGVANYGSMMNMLRKVGAEATLSHDPEEIYSAQRLILPGVGAFDSVAGALARRPDILEAMEAQVLKRRVPFMGVCVGMQLLFSGSEEGVLPGLGWIPGVVRKFKRERELPVPHMGWNVVVPAKTSTFFDEKEGYKFYFVHSYRACDVPAEYVLSTTVYGERFVSSVSAGNIFGFQFHPEKSHRYGVSLFKRFLEVKECC